MVRCCVENCIGVAGRPGTAQGMCSGHYHRWLRYGSATAPIRRFRTYAGQLCSEDSCGAPAKISQLCLNHYAVFRRQIRVKTDPEGEARRRSEFVARRLEKQEIKMGRQRPLRCEMCNETGYGRGNKPEAGICFDHNHETGEPRGWLCDRCNKVLGLVRDDIGLLHRMAEYLEWGGPPEFAEIRRSA